MRGGLGHFWLRPFGVLMKPIYVIQILTFLSMAACQSETVQPIVYECGNALVEGDEVCDDGSLNGSYGSCNADCTGRAPYCGDGVLDVAAGERCDNGELNSDTEPDSCRQDCQPARCGDGVVDTYESCDDGNLSNRDSCLSTCQPATCGDGLLNEEAEFCDDGNTLAGDGCPANCIGLDWRNVGPEHWPDYEWYLNNILFAQYEGDEVEPYETLWPSPIGREYLHTGTVITLEDGRMVGVPISGRSWLLVDPDTRDVTVISDAAGYGSYSDAVLAHDGKIYAMPRYGTGIARFDPATNEIEYIEVTDPVFRDVNTRPRAGGAGEGWTNMHVAPDGKLYMLPFRGDTVISWDPLTHELEHLGEVRSEELEYEESGIGLYEGVVYLPNGRLLGIPRGARRILEFSTETGELELWGDISEHLAKNDWLDIEDDGCAYSGGWRGGIYAPQTGLVYAFPNGRNQTTVLRGCILVIDPEARTTRTVTIESPDDLNLVVYEAVTLGPNGKIYGLSKNGSSTIEFDPLSEEIRFIERRGQPYPHGRYAFESVGITLNGNLLAFPNQGRYLIEIELGLDMLIDPNFVLSTYFNGNY